VLLEGNSKEEDGSLEKISSCTTNLTWTSGEPGRWDWHLLSRHICERIAILLLVK
jgi:hypothetical protein